MKKYLLIAFLTLASLVTRAQINSSSKVTGPTFQNGESKQIQIITTTGTVDTLYSKKTGQIDSLLALRAKKAHLDSLTNGTAAFSGITINGSNQTHLKKSNGGAGSAILVETVAGNVTSAMDITVSSPGTGGAVAQKNYHFITAPLADGGASQDINILLPTITGSGAGIALTSGTTPGALNTIPKYDANSVLQNTHITDNDTLISFGLPIKINTPATATGTNNALVFDAATGQIKQQAIGGSGLSIPNSQIAIGNSGGTGITSSSNLKFVQTPTIDPTGTYHWYGDSFTVGLDATSTKLRFSYLVSSAMGMTEDNNGISGSTLNGFSPSSIASYTTGDRVNICFGINDLQTTDSLTYPTSTFTSQYNAVAATISSKGYPASNVTLMSVPYFGNTTQILRQQYWNAIIKSIAVTYGYNFVDCYTVFKNGGGVALLGYGDIHPNNSGHKVIANSILSVIRASTNINQLEVLSDVRATKIRLDGYTPLKGNYINGIAGLDSLGRLGTLISLPNNTWASGDFYIGNRLIDSLSLIPTSSGAGDHILKAGSSIISSAVDPTYYGRFIPFNSSGGMSLYNAYGSGTIDINTSGGTTGGAFNALHFAANGDVAFGGNFGVGYNKSFTNTVGYTNSLTLTSGSGYFQISNLYPWGSGYTGGINLITAPVTGGTGVNTIRFWPSGGITQNPTGVTTESLSALNDIESTVRGSHAIPNMTTTQRDAIVKESIQSFTASGGTGYTNGASVVFGTYRGDGSDAAGTITTSGGVITGGTLNFKGWGYASAPTLSSAGGSGGTFTPVMGWRDGLEIYNITTGHKNIVVNGVWTEIPNANDLGTVTHVTSTTSTPTVTAGTITGTGATVTITGTDIAHQVMLTTGSTGLTGGEDIFDVTYNIAYTGSNPPVVVFSPANAAAAALTGGNAVFVGSQSNTGYNLNIGSTPLAASTLYMFNVHVLQ